MDDRTKKLVEYLGIETRVDKTIEECAELIQALCKYKSALERRKAENVSNAKAIYDVTEEMADVSNCIEQMIYLLGVEKQVHDIKQEKIERTFYRLGTTIFRNEQTKEEKQIKQNPVYKDFMKGTK